MVKCVNSTAKCVQMKCPHAVEHERNNHCVFAKCVMHQSEFVESVKECNNCPEKSECGHFRIEGNVKISNHPFNPGECHTKLVKYNCKCIEMND